MYGLKPKFTVSRVTYQPIYEDYVYVVDKWEPLWLYCIHRHSFAYE